MKTNIFRRLLSLLLVLTCSVSAAIVSCSPFAAAKTDAEAAGTASNAEPSKNEYQVVSPVPSGTSVTPITQPPRLSSLQGKKIALVGGSFSASVTHAVIRDLLEQNFNCITYYMTDEIGKSGTFNPNNISDKSIEFQQKLAQYGIDAVISGNCGCGICTVKETGNGLAAEYAGVPAVVVGAEAFVPQIESTGYNRGVPVVRTAAYPGAFASDTTEEQQRKAREILYPQIVTALTTQITQKLLNLKLKSKHDLSQNAGDIPNKYIFLSPEAEKYFHVKESNLYNKVTMKMFIPRLLEELSGFYREATCVETMGLFPVKFYDQKGNEVLSTMMSIPAVLSFNVYSDIQEDVDNYIVTYEPEALVCNLGIQKSVANVEYFINQIFLYSKSPQMPYDLFLEMMFRCMEINSIDLTGPSITYELLARRVCRTGSGDTFAKTYGKDQNVDPLSYNKLRFREAVQNDGVLQGVLFQSISESMNKGLAATLNGKKPVETPLERIIKA